MNNLHQVDWSAIPAPLDDGAADHLIGLALPAVALPATDGRTVQLATLHDLIVIYAYPMTGRPDTPLPNGWDLLPGARGCTPQSCAFRDHADELARLGVTHIYGLSTQDTDYQREAAQRLHLPFAILSDANLQLANALKLPTMQVDGKTLLKRLTIIARQGVIIQTLYPVFPPDQNAAAVIGWLQRQA